MIFAAEPTTCLSLSYPHLYLQDTFCDMSCAVITLFHVSPLTEITLCSATSILKQMNQIPAVEALKPPF